MAGQLDKHTKIKIFVLLPSYKQSCLEDKAPGIDSNTQDTEEILDNTIIIPGNMQEDSGNTQEDVVIQTNTEKDMVNTEENNHLLPDIQPTGHTCNIT